ncbi:MAG: pyridoxal-phosphate dependent enzyme [Myxococcota bacterium]
MTVLHARTPLLRSALGTVRNGAPVWLKCENLQPTGSFKLRGMGALAQAAVADGASALFSSSGGNAGYAVAYAGAALGVPVTVVVPQRTDPRMQDLIRGTGATVLVHGDVWDDAHAHALVLADEAEAPVIHPFDHPDVWRGHATLVHECAAALAKPPEVVVVAVGGGGLLCGVLQGLADVGWTKSEVLAVETLGAASYAGAVAAGTPITLDAIDTVALTLGAKRVCDQALAWRDRHPITSWTCTDADALAGCARFLDEHRMLVEPSCGAALAAVGGPTQGRETLVVVCGGAAVTRAQLATWEASVRQ